MKSFYQLIGCFIADAVIFQVDAEPGEGQSFIFVSENALETEDKLIIFIHGSGVVRAGQWARRQVFYVEPIEVVLLCRLTESNKSKRGKRQCYNLKIKMNMIVDFLKFVFLLQPHEMMVIVICISRIVSLYWSRLV